MLPWKNASLPKYRQAGLYLATTGKKEKRTTDELLLPANRDKGTRCLPEQPNKVVATDNFSGEHDDRCN
jgi:hypothetical protein